MTLHTGNQSLLLTNSRSPPPPPSTNKQSHCVTNLEWNWNDSNKCVERVITKKVKIYFGFSIGYFPKSQLFPLKTFKDKLTTGTICTQLKTYWLLQVLQIYFYDFLFPTLWPLEVKTVLGKVWKEDLSIAIVMQMALPQKNAASGFRNPDTQHPGNVHCWTETLPALVAKKSLKQVSSVTHIFL